MTMEDLTTRRLCDTMQGHRDEGAHREVILLPAPSVKKPGRVETREGTRTSPHNHRPPASLAERPRASFGDLPRGFLGEGPPGRREGERKRAKREMEAEVVKATADLSLPKYLSFSLIASPHVRTTEPHV